MTLAELHEHALRYLRGFFKDHGAMPTTFFALDRAKALHLLGVPKYPQQRAIYEALMTAYFAHHGVTAYGFATEVWYTVVPKDAVVVEGGRMRMAEGHALPEDRPDRKEALNTVALDANEIIYRLFEIERREGKPLRIGKDMTKPGATYPRAGILGLMVDYTKVPADTLAMSGIIVADAIQRGYLPIRRIVPQMVYDRGRN